MMGFPVDLGLLVDFRICLEMFCAQILECFTSPLVKRLRKSKYIHGTSQKTITWFCYVSLIVLEKQVHLLKKCKLFVKVKYTRAFIVD